MIFTLNNHLLAAHTVIFIIFHFLPSFNSNSFGQNFDLIRCLIDSFLKSKLMINVILNLSSSNYNFFDIIFILLCSTQLNKYIFERFLIKSRDLNSIYRNTSLAICFMIFATNVMPLDILKSDQIIISTTLILFIGYYMDNWYSPRPKLRPKKQGHFKLQPNAKT